MRERLSNRQIALVHVARRALGLTEDEYRDLLRGAAGVRSARELDPAGLDRVLSVFRELGFRPRPRRARRWDGLGHRPGKASPGQLRKLEALWAGVCQASRAAERDRRLRRWLLRQAGVADPAWLDWDAAGRCIDALKAWRKRLHGS